MFKSLGFYQPRVVIVCLGERWWNDGERGARSPTGVQEQSLWWRYRSPLKLKTF